MHFTYVLRSLKDHKWYIGHTSNLRKRVSAHQTGNVISTKNRRPFELVFYEAFKSIEDARRRERYFKTAKGKTTLKQVIRETIKDYT